VRQVAFVVCYRHIEAGGSARGRELGTAHRHSLDMVVVVVEGMESARVEARHNPVVEDEGLSSWVEEGIGLELGCSWVEEDIGFAWVVGCIVDNPADLPDGHRHNSLSST